MFISMLCFCPGSPKHGYYCLCLACCAPRRLQSTQDSRRNGYPQIHPLPSLWTRTVLPPAFAQLLHRAGSPAPHAFLVLSLLHGTVNPRVAGAKAGMKAPIVQYPCKGSVLRFLWGQGNAESQLTTQQDRVKLYSFDSLRAGNSFVQST